MGGVKPNAQFIGSRMLIRACLLGWCHVIHHSQADLNMKMTVTVGTHRTTSCYCVCFLLGGEYWTILEIISFYSVGVGGGRVAP